MPTLRKSVGLAQRKFWITSIAAAVLTVAAIFDWTRPPQEQKSRYAFEYLVVAPYRWVVRPVTSRFVQCRYVPTCSEYSVQAVRLHGLPKGLWLSTKRLFRCMPWVPMHTHDPVPPRDSVPKS